MICISPFSKGGLRGISAIESGNPSPALPLKKGESFIVKNKIPQSGLSVFCDISRKNSFCQKKGAGEISSTRPNDIVPNL